MGKKLTVTKKTSQHTTTPILRRTAIATAIAAIITPTGLQADNWQRNIEFFVAPTNKARALMGGAILQPLFQNENSLTYADLRAIFRFAQTEEFNFGLGHRMIYNDWILGGYFSFDTRNTERDVQHHAVTFGLEALSRQWDVNFNYYLPISGKETVATGTLGGTFIGTTLFSNGVVEEALEGVDFEVGALLPFVPIGETRLFLGTYYFDGDVAPSTGMGKKIRLEFRPRKNITLNFQATDDRLFDSEFSVQIKYSFGYAAESGVRTLSERMIQFHQRDIDIKTTAALPDLLMESGATGDRVLISDNVIHVDNEAAAGGDGSFLAPFDDIADATASAGGTQTDAFFYIHQGDGSSTGLDSTVNLLNNQTIFGEGANLFGLGGVGNFPLFDTGGDGVVLANNNEVAGLHIDGGDIGIRGDNVTGFNIHDNQLTNNYYGVRIQNIAGYGYSTNVSTTGTIANNLIDSNTYGIYLGNEASYDSSTTQNITITGNTATNNEYGLQAYNSAYGNNSSARQELTLTNNRFNSNDETGASFDNYSAGSVTSAATQVVRINGGNQFNNNSSEGAEFDNSAGGYYGYNGNATQIVTISGANQFNNNDDEGINVDNNADYYGTATQRFTITDSNQFNNNLDEGAEFDNSAGYGATATQTISISGTNQFNDSVTDEGAQFDSDATYGSTATQTVTISGANQFNNNDQEGINVDNDADYYSTATQTVVIDGNNQFNGNENEGAEFDNVAVYYSTATQNITVSFANQFNNNEQEGLELDNNASYGSTATSRLTISGANQFNNNEDEGLDVSNFAGINSTANQVVSIDGSNQFNGSLYDDGARFRNSTGSGSTSQATQTVNVTGKNQFNNNYDSGVNASNTSGYYGGGNVATQNINIGADNQLSGNGYYGLSAFNSQYPGSTANQTVNLTGASVTGNGTGNVYAYNAYGYGTQIITGP